MMEVVVKNMDEESGKTLLNVKIKGY